MEVDLPGREIRERIVAEIGWAAQMSAALNKEISLPLDTKAAKEFFKKHSDK